VQVAAVIQLQHNHGDPSMRWFAFSALAITLAWAAPVAAQSPGKTSPPKPTVTISPGELAATPEMWFYEQAMRQYQDPKTAVRQKAEYHAAERIRRLTALKWYGISKSRPVVHPDRLYGDYGPAWSSGNFFRPLTWSSPTMPLVVLRSNSSLTR